MYRYLLTTLQYQYLNIMEKFIDNPRSLTIKCFLLHRYFKKEDNIFQQKVLTVNLHCTCHTP